MINRITILGSLILVPLITDLNGAVSSASSTRLSNHQRLESQVPLNQMASSTCDHRGSGRRSKACNRANALQV